METKHCVKCDQTKSVEEFYKAKPRVDGSLRYHPNCKICVLEYGRTVYQKNPKYQENRKKRYENRSEESKIRNKEKGLEFYRSIRGRTLTLLKSAQRRSKNLSLDINVDYDFIYSQVSGGVCAATGLAFDLDKPEGSMKNPYAPSIDRVDPNKGYTKDNTRIVIWQYNLMKGEITDDELLKLCTLIVERNKNGLGL